MEQKPLSLLCISTYYKGANFLIGAKEAGCTVYFITVKDLESKPWPREHIDEIFYIDNSENTPQNHHNLALGVAYLMRSRKIDRIIALDDFDVEKAAYLRETFRIPGMGQTTGRYFRDKLAMRVQARDAGIKVPPFSTLFHDETVTEYLRAVEGPWLIKPRSEASATGIKKVHSLEEAWEVIHSLGDNRHNFLIEQFRPGNVFHVDALSQDGKFLFQRTSQYVNPPMEVAHEGGIFRSVTCEFGGDDDKKLQEMNKKVMEAFGMKNSASHTEYIKSAATGEFYFLETAARVGGANLMEMVEASAGINLWREWANMEVAIALKKDYKMPKVSKDYSGIIISLSRYQYPDTSSFNDPEIVWRMKDEFHIGFIVKAKTRERVLELLDGYAKRIAKDFHASAPAPDKTVH
jgi:hypothetical protein